MEELHVSGDISVQEAGEQVVDDAAKPREPQITVGGDIETPPDLPPTGFFDPDDPGSEPDITLKRVIVARDEKPRPTSLLKRIVRWISEVMTEDEREMFELTKPIGYYDGPLDQVIVVPANLAKFQTDLTSVPRLFTWLVPRTGAHLPAALVHDGLVHRPDEPPTYISDKEV
ncbi:MAG: DUF1353 domain-containing protein, partial [Actinomycetota bacterium]